ncbi:MAG: 16S rRNA (adenine(1518)-N(6)/adenine(1519)-N(6))-dimethyltransferase RsmA [Rickettsiales bacterium]|nr:16S rRNA (adenine(1518)-N(6)/adenine(1519)-N(6))-dimethyltransferase RsmA [Rickettsiales bacterium]
MRKYSFCPQKKFGQNFLLRNHLIEKIVDSAGVIADQNLLEIGPGFGGLTIALLKRNPRRLVSIELDAKLAKIITAEIKPFFSNLEILNIDALTVDENILFDNKFKIVANLPYNIGTTLLFKWLKECNGKIENMTLLMQKEVVDRIGAVPKTKEYGYLSVICQYFCKVKKCFDISPGEFIPSPKVTSSIVNLAPNDSLKPEKSLKFIELVSLLFRKKRKTILNNMIDHIANAKDVLQRCQIDPSVRSEELKIGDFLRILECIETQNVLP